MAGMMKPTVRAWILGLVAWAVPGAGHWAQGRWGRGLLLGGSVLLMCGAGGLLGGQFNDVTVAANGFLPRVFGFFSVGTGIFYVWSLMTGVWLSDPAIAEVAKTTTFEYGNTFLMVAGLLNYLVALDAFDLAVGRKS